MEWGCFFGVCLSTQKSNINLIKNSVLHVRREELQVVTGKRIVFDLAVFIYATILFLLWDCSKMVAPLFHDEWGV